MSHAEAHARMTDPASSELAVNSIGKDLTIRQLILDAAAAFDRQDRARFRRGAEFTDTDLTDEIEAVTKRRQQRNVIARSRGLLEKEGRIERVGMYSVNGRPYMHFRLVVPAP